MGFSSGCSNRDPPALAESTARPYRPFPPRWLQSNVVKSHLLVGGQDDQHDAPVGAGLEVGVGRCGHRRRHAPASLDGAGPTSFSSSQHGRLPAPLFFPSKRQPDRAVAA